MVDKGLVTGVPVVQEGLQVDAGITGVLENKELRRKGEGMLIVQSKYAIFPQSNYLFILFPLLYLVN